MVHEAWSVAKRASLDIHEYQEELVSYMTSYEGVSNAIAVLLLQEVKISLKLIQKSSERHHDSLVCGYGYLYSRHASAWLEKRHRGRIQ